MTTDRLLPGESVSNPTQDDALHWTLVYTELIATKRSLIRALQDMLKDLNPVARAELERDDMTALAAELARFERRFGVWQRRLHPVAR